MVLSRIVNGRTSWNCGADSIVEPDLAVFSRQISWLILSLYTQISRKVYVSPCLMLPTKFSHNVTFMVADGSAIMACCSCRFSEPTVFERYKWVTLAVTVTIWPGHTDLMVDRFIVVGSLTLSKSIAGKCSMVTSWPIGKSSAFDFVSMRNFLIFTGEFAWLRLVNLFSFGGEKHTPRTVFFFILKLTVKLTSFL